MGEIERKIQGQGEEILSSISPAVFPKTIYIITATASIKINCASIYLSSLIEFSVAALVDSGYFLLTESLMSL